MPEPIEIRDAQPTYDEGLAAARFIDMASEGGIRKALGRRYTDIIANAFVEPDHHLSYEHAVFAVQAGSIVGMVSGYAAEQQENSSIDPLKKAPGNRLRRAIGLALLRVILSVMGNHESGDFYVAFAGVDDKARGHGVGSKLLAALESRARERGATRFTLDVSARNEGAKRLYQRLGLSVESRYPKTRLLPTFAYRMGKALQEPDAGSRSSGGGT